ncbi:MAG: hypothetical protein FD169_2548 [Bacillota bacterium]|nr:MAG: hypothetical protein FD169_2548 [Bacillota bacterium]
MSYFVIDERGVLTQRLETLLNQAKAHLSLDDVVQAQALFQECQNIYDSTLLPETLGLYREVMAGLQLKKSALFESVVSFVTAADAYLSAGCCLKAWDCKYAASFSLYKAGHLTYAVSIAVDALKIIMDEVEFAGQLRRTHYLIGCCYAAVGEVSQAQRHFACAEKEAGLETTEIGVRALIGRASCYGREGNWAAALEASHKAANLSDRGRFAKLKAEALIGACVCLVSMQETIRAGDLLAEVIGMPNIAVRTKRKAYREVILALNDLTLTDVCRPYERELKKLLGDLDPDTRDWEVVKDEWALAKCSLLRDPQGTKEQTLSFSQKFVSFMRYRDAAEVLIFGADLLIQHNQTNDAYGLLKSACDLLKK